MISLFDDDGVRQSITWMGIEFNDATAEAGGGFVTDAVAFDTPTNFASETKDDIVKGGGGIEFYNPRVNNRVMTLAGHVHAPNESTLGEYLYPLQRAFNPLYLQSLLTTNRAGTAVWPPPAGEPSWVTAYPFKFTRVMTRDYAPSAFPSGKMLLQYYVVPLQMPDPIRAVTQTGISAAWEASFLILYAGRSFGRTQKTLVGNGSITPAWAGAPAWPLIRLAMAGAGSSTFTITTSSHHMSTALVLNLSSAGASTIDIDCHNRKIYSNFIYDGSPYYGSGDFPVLHPSAATTFTYTNTTNLTSATVYYNESDYV